MAGPALAFELLGQAGHPYPGDGFGPPGIEILVGGQVEEVATGGLQGLAVLFQGTRIALEILAGAELQGVDEDTGDDAVAGLSCLFDQGQMPGMQVAHGRHEGNALAGLFPLADVPAQGRQLGYLEHGVSRNPVRGRGNLHFSPLRHRPLPRQRYRRPRP